MGDISRELDLGYSRAASMGASLVLVTIFPVEQLLDLLSENHLLSHPVDVLLVCGTRKIRPSVQRSETETVV